MISSKIISPCNKPNNFLIKYSSQNPLFVVQNQHLFLKNPAYLSENQPNILPKVAGIFFRAYGLVVIWKYILTTHMRPRKKKVQIAIKCFAYDRAEIFNFEGCLLSFIAASQHLPAFVKSMCFVAYGSTRRDKARLLWCNPIFDL